MQRINRYRTVMLYLIFGVLTTIINILSYYMLLEWHANIQVAVVISWLLSILFAYSTNKIWFFQSSSQSFRGIIREMSLFFSARVITLLVEMIIIWFGVQLLRQNPIVWKVIDNIVVVLVNYIFSQRVIFQTKTS
ncbi:GtrA family protein [Leuconostoc carnosum]|uniref:GtcA family membrane protein n=2 Tax=Leuconostoc carnosum TaxID=1252 RepID=K0D7Z6_LEUCJ|nr:GtrA family protein [Leuconostoc carnosum]AFT80933.1 GtcA family membrane protein [Leuconostoc carnosum JB16]KAA8327155.1 GtrA family protein [Leuconostoc carnosum]QEA33501.1 GtrA family protein [Leuconostoc carnosum]